MANQALVFTDTPMGDYLQGTRLRFGSYRPFADSVSPVHLSFHLSFHLFLDRLIHATLAQSSTSHYALFISCH